MTRPQIIRADTIDLQDHDAPSAKDHTRQPARPAPLGDGPPAPHQAETLKHIEQGAALEMHTRSPRHSKDLSDKELQLLHEDVGSYGSNDGSGSNQELHNLQRNGDSGGINGADGGLEDIDGDDGMDDDLLDKISSSPSIDDGGYPLPLPRTSSRDCLLSTSTQEEEPPVLPKHDDLSSSPFLSSPAHFPLIYPREERDQPLSEDHHQEGRYSADQKSQFPSKRDYESEALDLDSPMTTRQRVSHFHEDIDDSQDSYNMDIDLNDFQHLLLPADDPLLDNSFDDAPLSPSSSDSSSPGSSRSWEDEPSDNNDDDDDTEDISFSDDSRFIDSGWGGECLREIEDIDFEFVYALHTFVATVEGQANATKGDTMVLLDDSNSYWWLVRVVKDSSIGYLPAEHIETPTERLARLNKHRNIDLSQTMLGDNPEKSKNPLKKAMRRRNAKTVQFAAPQYFDPSDVEYSTDEEEQEDGEYLTQQEGAEPQDQDQGREVDESATVEPLKSRSDTIEPASRAITDSESRGTGVDQSIVAEKPRTSNEILELEDGAAGKPGRRTVRNTDSFFKDDSLETKKINLTPSLLRDDSNGSPVKSNEVKELKPRGSLDSLEKITSSQEKAKEDKKRKEKKGMLNGLFKRKDKKSKGQDDETEDAKKSFEESRLSPQPKESSDSFSQDVQPSKANSQSQPQRQTSKLQKSPPVSYSASANRSNTSNRSQPTKPLAPRDEPIATNSVITEQQKTDISGTNRAPQPAPEPNLSVRAVQHEERQGSDDMPSLLRVQPTEHPLEEQFRPDSLKDTSHGVFSPITNVLRPSPPALEPRAEQVRTATQRMPMDDSDSSSDTEETPTPLTNHDEPGPSSGPTQAPRERLSESPVQVTSQDPPPTKTPPPLMIDTSSQEDPSTSPVSPLSSPELIEAPQEGNAREATPASTAQSSTSTPTWSDASLRAYLEDDTDIRDLLVVVHDKSDVKPAAADHPIVKSLFKEENRKLGEISNRLDGLLGDFLARKSRLSPSK